jgi:thiosulfate/3-mercaptopyruvate sulfurtransferase
MTLTPFAETASMPAPLIRTGGLLAAAAFAIAAAPALAAPDGWSTLLTPQELASLLEADPDGEIRVVHVSGEAEDGYIPGAVSAPYPEWRGPADNPGALPEIGRLHDVLHRTGIEAETPVVVVHSGASQTDFGTAARVYWTLKSLGVEDLAILNGGLAGWKAAGLPVEADEGGVFPSAWQPELSDEWRVTSAEIAELVEAGEVANLVDARPPGFFEGLLWHDAAASPGTLPGSANLTYEIWFDGDSFVSPERAREIAVETGQTDAPLTVSFCNTGHWAAINWFALSELAGVENTRLYAESIVEWSQAGGEMMNQPSRIAFYWMQVRNWFQNLWA